MTINQYISKHLNRGKKIIPHIICADGFHMSVQVGQYNYCEPRIDSADSYRSMEVGYPSHTEPLLIKYAEDMDRPTETVYDYVPVDVIDVVIAEHGGMAGWFKRILINAWMD